ncbi:MAG: hypothetical protein L0216_10045, partial [Planctomycetales bacterium]|nr:hypothetical protein [Planctomycetales bacterium]
AGVATVELPAVSIPMEVSVFLRSDTEVDAQVELAPGVREVSVTLFNFNQRVRLLVEGKDSASRELRESEVTIRALDAAGRTLSPVRLRLWPGGPGEWQLRAYGPAATRRIALSYRGQTFTHDAPDGVPTGWPDWRVR